MPVHSVIKSCDLAGKSYAKAQHREYRAEYVFLNFLVQNELPFLKAAAYRDAKVPRSTVASETGARRVLDSSNDVSRWFVIFALLNSIQSFSNTVLHYSSTASSPLVNVAETDPSAISRSCPVRRRASAMLAHWQNMRTFHQMFNDW